MAQSRLEEIERLSSQLVDTRKELDKEKCQQQQLPEATVKESVVYKNLQSQFSIAVMEGVQLRSCLEEAKSLLASARQLHFSQFEEIRSDLLWASYIVFFIACAGLRKSSTRWK